MNFSFGDIFYVSYDPSVGHEYKGKRPAMVIQEEDLSGAQPVVTVMAMTSQLRQLRSFDILIQKDNKNRLPMDSVIKVHHINSFDKQRFISKIGRAGSPTIRAVRGYLRRHFGL